MIFSNSFGFFSSKLTNLISIFLIEDSKFLQYSFALPKLLLQDVLAKHTEQNFLTLQELHCEQTLLLYVLSISAIRL